MKGRRRGTFVLEPTGKWRANFRAAKQTATPLEFADDVGVRVRTAEHIAHYKMASQAHNSAIRAARDRAQRDARSSARQ